MKKVVV